MAILLIEVPFKVAGRWREYTSRVRPWWAAGEGESSKVQEMYLSKRAEKKIHVHKLPSCYMLRSYMDRSHNSSTGRQ